MERPADSRRALPHAGEAPVSFQPILDYVAIHAPAVISNSQGYFLVGILHLQRNVLRAGMAKRVG
jgi:hypothetical protein